MADDRLTRRGFIAAGASLGLAACASGADVTGTGGIGETVTVEGMPIRYARTGEGPPVVLIHGASGNLNDMTFRLAPALARDHTVISFDRPGHGASGWPTTGGETLSTQAALMRGALRAIGIPRAALIGHSYGGSVALAWALDDPDSVASLTLLGAPSQTWQGGLGLTTDLLANPLTGPILSRLVGPLVTESFAQSTLASVFAPQPAPPGYLAHLDLALVVQPSSLRRNALQLDALKEQLRPMIPRYAGMSVPTEILHGTADATVGLDIHSAILITQLPNARLTRLDGIGHMIHQVDLPAVLTAQRRLAET